MLNKIKLLVSVGAMIMPVLAFSASVSELEEKINELKQELETTNDILHDLNDRVEYGVEFSGYTDVEYITSNNEDINDSFRMHHFNLQASKNFGNKWYFFSEIEFENAPRYEGEGHEQDPSCVATPPDTCAEGAVVHEAKGGIFLEAMNITYRPQQEFNIRFGRTLTPAGIWNVEHYTSIVPTQERPQFITHEEGIFPSSLDGAQVFGTVPVRSTFFKYDLYAGNGRGENPGAEDDNRDKAIGARASFVFPLLTNFELGASYYTDDGDNSHEGEVRLISTGVHGKISDGPLSLQFEVAEGKSDDGIEEEKARGYYAQLVYDWNKYAFGVRNDFYNPHANEPDLDAGTTVNSLFVNYHVNAHVTLKAEHHMYNHEDSSVDDYYKTIFSVVGYLGS